MSTQHNALNNIGTDNRAEVEKLENEWLKQEDLKLWKGRVIEAGRVGIVWRDGKWKLYPAGKIDPFKLYHSVFGTKFKFMLVDIRPGLVLPVESRNQLLLKNGLTYNYRLEAQFQIKDPVLLTVGNTRPMERLREHLHREVGNAVRTLDFHSEDLARKDTTNRIEERLMQRCREQTSLPHQMGVEFTSFTIRFEVEKVIVETRYKALEADQTTAQQNIARSVAQNQELLDHEEKLRQLQRAVEYRQYELDTQSHVNEIKRLEALGEATAEDIKEKQRIERELRQKAIESNMKWYSGLILDEEYEKSQARLANQGLGQNSLGAAQMPVLPAQNQTSVPEMFVPEAISAKYKILQSVTDFTIGELQLQADGSYRVTARKPGKGAKLNVMLDFVFPANYPQSQAVVKRTASNNSTRSTLINNDDDLAEVLRRAANTNGEFWGD